MQEGCFDGILTPFPSKKAPFGAKKPSKLALNEAFETKHSSLFCSHSAKWETFQTDIAWLYPHFVVGRHEKHVLKPLKSDRAAKRPIFTHFKADFRAQNGQQGLPGNMAENWVIWVKKSTSNILIREVILEVGDAEKRVFSLF